MLLRGGPEELLGFRVLERMQQGHRLFQTRLRFRCATGREAHLAQLVRSRPGGSGIATSGDDERGKKERCQYGKRKAHSAHGRVSSSNAGILYCSDEPGRPALPPSAVRLDADSRRGLQSRRSGNAEQERARRLYEPMTKLSEAEVREAA